MCVYADGSSLCIPIKLAHSWNWPYKLNMKPQLSFESVCVSRTCEVSLNHVLTLYITGCGPLFVCDFTSPVSSI